MEGAVYAARSDLTALGVPLSAAQLEAADVLLATASARLRLLGKQSGKDLDAIAASDADYAVLLRHTVVQAVLRALNSLSDAPQAVAQGTETNGAYSVSMTYLNAGQALYFLRNELKELGLLRQTISALEIYGE